MKPAIIRNPEEGSGGGYAHPRGCPCSDTSAHERRSGNERRTVPRWIEYTRADDRRGKALDHS